MAANTAQPDLSEFFKLSKPKRRPCSLGFVLTQLKPAERKQLEAAVATDAGIITNAAIEGWVKARGHETNVSAVVSHRKGTCTCSDE